MAHVTVTDAGGAVLAQIIVRPGQTPADAGWPVEPGQRFFPVDRQGDAATEHFDAAAGQWVPDLSKLRALRWEEVRTHRDRAEWWGCATPLGRADSDPDSQRKVAGAVQMAMIAQGAGAPFSIDWTMQDNSSVTHDAAAMILLGVNIGQHVAACHAVALAKRAAIEAATDPAALALIDVAEGWPDAPTG